ncbi:MAG: hypothetical protein ABS68_09295 [Niastella sp. SCN 39-18]|nr:MAG: hypothetical protein ABS68_09295 [Niastella sp. SCN 39-18]OJW10430.1 MAG: hypothetical protein BGO53_09600 [Sphingobacteriales bacterium 39-19]
MQTFKTYISFVIQSGDQHVHAFEIADLKLPTFNFYADNTSQEVLEWAEQKQKTLNQDEKLIILNYFNISNVK